MPLGLWEAMSVGLACIATDVDEIPEELKPSGGLIIPPKDVAALKDAMLLLLGKPGIQKEMTCDSKLDVPPKVAITYGPTWLSDK